MAKMQVTVDGTLLDNTTWRAITGSFGDDPSGEGQRVLVCDFIVEGSTADELQQRLLTTYEAFTKRNCRVVFTLDDTVGSTWADVSPNDGKHTEVHCTVGVATGYEQTANRQVLRLYIVAGMTPVLSTGAAGSNPAYFQGLLGSLKYTRTINAARFETRSLLATFVDTFDDDANGPYTIDSVANSGGKAVFHITAAPVVFAVGQRLKVTAGTAYLGVHLVTAINVGAQTITTDTSYSATATGTAYIGTLTSGETNYNSAKATLLTDYLGTASTGARDGTTGLSLVTEIPETSDENGNQFTVMLQSGPMQDMANTSSARVANLSIKQSEPEKWNTRFGTKPKWFTARGSLSCSKTVLGGTALFSVWASSAQGDILTLVKAKTGQTNLKILDLQHESDDGAGVISFEVKYQAVNTSVLAGNITVNVDEGDDAVGIREVTGFDYEQRPPGFTPKTCIVAVSRIGVGEVDLSTYVTLPATGGGTWRRVKKLISSEKVTCLFSPNVYSQTYTAGFERKNYSGGATVDVVGP